jgi:NAD(P)-dependent dehydrogenase (short-subunit alcohol dehydrogenase family)
MEHSWHDQSPLMIKLFDLTGRKAVVTGASRGIGKTVIEALRANGAFCYGLSNEAMESDDPASFMPLQCDLSDSTAIQMTVERIREVTDALDYLVNVAGIDPKYVLEAGDESAWQRIIDLNLRAYYLLIRGCVPLLKRGRGKAIVNVSSINYRLGISGRAIYSTSKAGILGLTTGLARELGRQSIRINTVSPGWVFTERQIQEYFEAPDADCHLNTLAERQSLPIKIHPLDVANHILFYLSEVSRTSTGHNCVVDGGWLLE